MLSNIGHALPPSVKAALRSLRSQFYPGWKGYCPICEKSVRFSALGPWYRDQLICSGCNSIPRERALMQVLQTIYPGWRNVAIHELSPGSRGASIKLRRECSGYVASQYDTSIAFGALHISGEYQSQDLERQTFADRSFDIVVT